MIYTLCGSTRFPDAFALANMHLSALGHVVIGLGMSGHTDEPRGARFLTSDGDETTPGKRGLDELHLRKIDLSDAIFVVNVAGYIGSSTRREIAHAWATGKAVVWMFPDAAGDPAEAPTREGPHMSALMCGQNEVLPDGCPECGGWLHRERRGGYPSDRGGFPHCSEDCITDHQDRAIRVHIEMRDMLCDCPICVAAGLPSEADRAEWSNYVESHADVFAAVAP